MYLDAAGKPTEGQRGRLSRGRRSGLGARLRIRLEEVWAEAVGGSGGARRGAGRERASRFPMGWRESLRGSAERPGALSGIEAHLSARRQVLRSRRNAGAAGTGAHAGAHRASRARAISTKARRRACWPPTWSEHGGLITLADLKRLRRWSSAAADRAAIAATTLSRRRRPAPAASASCRCWACWKAPATRKRARARPRSCTYLAETMRRFFADRAAYMGDPDFVKVPVAGLLDPAYIAQLAEVDRSGARHAQRADSRGQAGRRRRAARPRTTRSWTRRATRWRSPIR